MRTLTDRIHLPYKYTGIAAPELDKAFELVDEELVREEEEFVALEMYDARETARAASPIAVTAGGLAGAAVLAAGGPPAAAFGAGVAALIFVAWVVESSLRRMTA